MSDGFHVGDNINMIGHGNTGKKVFGSPDPTAEPRPSRGVAGRPDSRVVWREPLVFINYRKADEKAAADIEAELTRQLGSGAVFRDAGMLAGTEFPRELDDRASSCKVMISVIGRQWDDTNGLRLLGNRTDWVRREIAAALTHGVQVVPVLVGVRDRLTASDLPRNIRKIAHLQGPHLPRGYGEQHVRQLVEKLVRELPSLREANRF